MSQCLIVKIIIPVTLKPPTSRMLQLTLLHAPKTMIDKYLVFESDLNPRRNAMFNHEPPKNLPHKHHYEVIQHFFIWLPPTKDEGWDLHMRRPQSK